MPSAELLVTLAVDQVTGEFELLAVDTVRALVGGGLDEPVLLQLGPEPLNPLPMAATGGANEVVIGRIDRLQHR